MAERPRTILICSCEDTIPLDGEAVHRVCRGAELIEGRLVAGRIRELQRLNIALSPAPPTRP